MNPFNLHAQYVFVNRFIDILRNISNTQYGKTDDINLKEKLSSLCGSELFSVDASSQEGRLLSCNNALKNSFNYALMIYMAVKSHRGLWRIVGYLSCCSATYNIKGAHQTSSKRVGKKGVTFLKEIIYLRIKLHF